MKTLIAIDPGACSGVAIFAANVLVWSWAGSVDEGPGCHVPEALRGVRLFDSDLVIEIPQVYPGPRQEDPNDLIKTALVAGRWIERMVQEVGTRPPVEVRPREWKGQVPKDIHNARVRASLTMGELACLPDLPKSKLHNAIDAVGLGLWRLGRMGRGK